MGGADVVAIRTIQKRDLLTAFSENAEGLILQGCGGDPAKWLDAINEAFTSSGILLERTEFQEDQCAVFQTEGRTCILFNFDSVKLDIGKLAVWRLETYAAFGGMWLSDYMDHLKARMERDEEKVNCPLIGADGNIFHIIGVAARTLREHDREELAKEMTQRVTQQAGSYAEALHIIGEYVHITAVNQEEEEGMSMF